MIPDVGWPSKFATYPDIRNLIPWASSDIRPLAGFEKTGPGVGGFPYSFRFARWRSRSSILCEKPPTPPVAKFAGECAGSPLPATANLFIAILYDHEIVFYTLYSLFHLAHSRIRSHSPMNFATGGLGGLIRAEWSFGSASE